MSVPEQNNDRTYYTFKFQYSKTFSKCHHPLSAKTLLDIKNKLKKMANAVVVHVDINAV